MALQARGALTPAVVAVLVALLSMACAPEPYRAQNDELLDQLDRARGMLAEQPPRVSEACNVVGDVQTRLYGEPGLVDVKPAWPQLRDAADALQAACGDGTWLGMPSTETPAITAARLRWQQGIQREIGVACDHLRAAATALAHGTPCS
jgi:hypothetical protein